MTRMAQALTMASFMAAPIDPVGPQPRAGSNVNATGASRQHVTWAISAPDCSMNPAKELRRAKQTEMSSRASEICRAIVFGLLAVSYGIYSSDNSFANSIISTHGRLLRYMILFAATGVICDFAQYSFGYRAATAAFRNVSDGYNYNTKSFSYRIWELAYILKVAAVVVVCTIVAAIAGSYVVAQQTKARAFDKIYYVTFDDDKYQVADFFYPMLNSILTDPSISRLTSVELMASSNSTNVRDEKYRIAIRRANHVKKILIDLGAPASIIKVLAPQISSASLKKTSIANRIVRIRLKFETKD